MKLLLAFSRKGKADPGREPVLRMTEGRYSG